MSLRPGEIVLVDWDNTLHDAEAGYFAALRTVMARRGRDLDLATYRAAYDPDYRTLYARLGLPAADVPAASAEWRELATSHEPALLPGARDALESLRQAGLALGIVTAADRAMVEDQISRLDLDWLPVLVAGGEASIPRPDPAPLILALERAAGMASKSSYTGDTPGDVLMARRAGVWSVGIASFAFDEGELRAAGADETAPSFADWVSRRITRGW